MGGRVGGWGAVRAAVDCCTVLLLYMVLTRSGCSGSSGLGRAF